MTSSMSVIPEMLELLKYLFLLKKILQSIDCLLKMNMKLEKCRKLTMLHYYNGTADCEYIFTSYKTQIINYELKKRLLSQH